MSDALDTTVPVRAETFYSEDQERAPNGKWTTGAGGSVVAYHGTVASVLDKIKREGIKVGGKRTFDDPKHDPWGGLTGAVLYGDERGRSVFVANTKQTAMWYARQHGRGKPVVLELRIPKGEWKSFHKDSEHKGRGAAYSTHAIKPGWIVGAYDYSRSVGVVPRKFAVDDDMESAWVVLLVDEKAEADQQFAGKSALKVPATDVSSELRSAFLDAYQAGADAVAAARGAEAAVGSAADAAAAYADERAGALITGIDETTLSRVEGIIASGVQAGQSDTEVADRLTYLFGEDRANLIARNEMATAWNLGVVNALKDAGEEYVYVSDPDECDQDICDVDGEFWTLEEAEAEPLGHVNCGRDFRPCTSDELAELAAEESDTAAEEAASAEGGVRFYSEAQPRVAAGEPGGGEWGDGGAAAGIATAHLSEKAVRAKDNAKLNDTEIQRWGERNEDGVVALVGKGETSKLADPLDVRVTLGNARHGVEVKSLFTNTNDKITTRGPALEAKLQAGRDENRRLHTVVFDERSAYVGKGAVPNLYSGHRIYYHAGVGSFRLGSMTPVRDGAHLRQLMGKRRP